jgi:hypothetical protein
MDLNRERIRRAFLQRLMAAAERIITGQMSAGWERFLSGEPESPSGRLLRSFVQRDWMLGLGRFSRSGRAYKAYV